MTLFTPSLYHQAEKLLTLCREKQVLLVTAESCTGGLITALFTEIPGASEVLWGGFVTYANAAKTAMIGVSAQDIATYGAVSKEVAIAMAEGAIAQSTATVSIAVTGIAGPSGGTPAKPVGLVHMASHVKEGGTTHQEHRFSGDREEIRREAVAAAMALLENNLLRR